VRYVRQKLGTKYAAKSSTSRVVHIGQDELLIRGVVERFKLGGYDKVLYEYVSHRTELASGTGRI